MRFFSLKWKVWIFQIHFTWNREVSCTTTPITTRSSKTPLWRPTSLPSSSMRPTFSSWPTSRPLSSFPSQKETWSLRSVFFASHDVVQLGLVWRSNLSVAYLLLVWPDGAIYWTLGHFLKPLVTINLLKLPLFLGNFCKCVIIYYFLMKSFLGNFYRHLVIFSGYPACYLHCFYFEVVNLTPWFDSF